MRTYIYTYINIFICIRTYTKNTPEVDTANSKKKPRVFERLQCCEAQLWWLHSQYLHVTWLIYVCALNHSYVCHNSFMNVLWLIHACVMSHSYLWHDSFLMGHNCDGSTLTHYNTLHRSITQRTATHCNTRCYHGRCVKDGPRQNMPQIGLHRHTWKHCNTWHRTATHCIALQHPLHDMT